MQLTGRVSSGLGRAHIFMAQSHYQDQFKQVLGATAWPGTLNVHVGDEDFIRYIALRHLAGVDTLGLDDDAVARAGSIDLSGIESVRIRGFLRDGVSFGGATAFPAVLSTDGEELDCAILIPDLTRHVDVVEVICSSFLREACDLVDGDIVDLSL